MLCFQSIASSRRNLRRSKWTARRSVSRSTWSGGKGMIPRNARGKDLTVDVRRSKRLNDCSVKTWRLVNQVWKQQMMLHPGLCRERDLPRSIMPARPASGNEHVVKAERRRTQLSGTPYTLHRHTSVFPPKLCLKFCRSCRTISHSFDFAF